MFSKWFQSAEQTKLEKEQDEAMQRYLECVEKHSKQQGGLRDGDDCQEEIAAYKAIIAQRKQQRANQK